MSRRGIRVNYKKRIYPDLIDNFLGPRTLDVLTPRGAGRGRADPETPTRENDTKTKRRQATDAADGQRVFEHRRPAAP